ncbi:MaoC domain protein dehydratase [Desulfamplus magnetovallimortis]|uniref:MaoC domain protein dehydratase n=1 Tax=Desulfamplus magnetovallimortis TaxID=1246637 RepID=A0A1W1H6S8_9BACT|nr:MaoC family dehydratase [Desulfamplus magnetovallimortis]SLM28159.1 MaoC domain protein dehydratase [Desulfamplus magnetovallimortis]
MTGRTIDELNIGDFEQFSKTVSESDIYLFAGISGDMNPAHIDEQYAAGTFFKGRIAHGILVGSFISTVIGMKIPGPGTIYLEQQYRFKAPVRIGDTITARVEVTEKIVEKNKVMLKTTCTNQNDVVVIDGSAVVSPPKKK